LEHICIPFRTIEMLPADLWDSLRGIAVSVGALIRGRICVGLGSVNV
jgi:hypothetical protein